MDKVSLPLKAFVIGSGILLIVGTTALAVLMVLRIGADPPPPAAPAPAPPLESFVPLPDGARIDQVVPDPAHGRLLLLGTAGDGSPFLALIDPDRGRLVGMIRFGPAPAP
ncbi:MAG TPA: hypothetical protein VFZ01_06230 [Geminicoccaceae bacterium]